MWHFFATFAGPIATFIASVAALFVTWRFGTMQADVARAQAKNAQEQVRIAETQKNIAAARLNFDLFEKRYAVFDAARNLLIHAIREDHVKLIDVNKFLVETSDAVFLFDKDIAEYLNSLREKIIRLRVIKKQEKKVADETGDERKRQHLVDLESEVHMALSDELPTMIEKFKPYLLLGNV